MLKNYLITTLRILMKNNLFTIINIGGLTVGLTAAFLIILFVLNEVDYDRWIPNHDRIFTIETISSPPDRAPASLARTALEIRSAMEKDFAEIESFTRFYAGSTPVKIGDMLFPEKSFRIEETFFDIFGFPFIEGDRQSALTNSYSAVISEKLAIKYFGETKVLGQSLSVGDTDFIVTGVMQNLPAKTHLDAEILLYEGVRAHDIDFIDWTSARLYSYFILADGANIETIQQATATFLNNNAFFAPESWQDYTPSDVMDLYYRPITDIHLHQRAQNPISPNGSITLVYGFAGIAALIMVMASINFINLSTANASTREKEIAIHKVVGAQRAQLITRYLSEAIILMAAAYIISLALTEILAPGIFNWIGVALPTANSFNTEFLILSSFSSLFTAIAAGIYPAVHLSSKSPADTFSGGQSHAPRVAKFRIGLVFFQYTVSIILVIAAAHFYMQTKLATTMDLGFSDERVAAYWGVTGAESAQNQRSLLERVRQIDGVSAATLMAQLPGPGSQNNVNLKAVTNDRNPAGVRMQAVAAASDFEKTLEMSLVAGRSFDQNRPLDRMIDDDNEINGTPPIVINELALTALGFNRAEDAIGQIFQMQDYISDPYNVEIIGVMNNAHFQSIHSEAGPMLFANAYYFFNALVVKFDLNSAAAEQEIADIWENYVPDVAVYQTYLTDTLADQYALEQQQTQVFGVFSTLAVVIAFLGIFGLAAFNVERRTKEVGIRKVFGARVIDIVRLFVWQFSKPVMWAVLAAWPVAGLIISRWLESYAYRIDLAPLVFISAGASVLMVAWLTIASQAAKVAMQNPIYALRHD